MSIVFLSDVHVKTGKDCEELFAFIRTVINNEHSVKRVVMLGDIIDFWYDYRGFVKAEFMPLYMMFQYLKDKNVIVDYIAGNHDFALGDYFKNYFNVNTYEDQDYFIIDEFGIKILCGHGDRIVKKGAYKYLSLLLNFKINQKIFSLLPPWVGEFLSQSISTKSRKRSIKIEHSYTDQFKEFLSDLQSGVVSLCEENNCSYGFVGHSHQDIRKDVNGITFQNTGSWGFYGDYYILNNDNGAINLSHFVYEN